MPKNKTHKIFALLFAAVFWLTACGEKPNPEIAIQTSVAETVAAQTPVVITQTPADTPFPTKTPFAAPTFDSAPTMPPTASGLVDGKFECAKASLQDETVVDGKIFKAGEQFVKTWYVKNESPCVWDETYRIIYWDGDLLGGAYYYPMPQAVAPGQTVPITVLFTAPSAPGKYRSSWKLQTPDKISYGAGMYDAAFYADIVVADLTTTTALAYDIVAADLTITREPAYGCEPANMVYTARVVISTNGPLKFKYQIRQQDGNNSYKREGETNESGKFTDSKHTWMLGRAADQNNTRWMQIVITEPFYREYPPVYFEFYCP
ncbi:MAG: hypothetical protein LC099_09690 [Anaerolineales bacterium]|nr:hypothetical protein [Anaerolineales bacterium]